MMPNTSVSPAARRNSISPNCRLFSDCSRSRIPDMNSGSGSQLSRSVRRQLNYDPDPEFSLHLAVFGPEVAEAVDYRADLLVDDAALAILGDHTQVVVLHRRAVVRELPVAARRFETPRRGHQRLVERRHVLDLAVHAAHGGVDQERRGVALLGKKRRDAFVLFLEPADEFAVGVVVEV